MVTLSQDDNGNYRARKRLPDDVRAEYGRLYGARHEAKFSAPKTTKAREAKQLYREWLEDEAQRLHALAALAEVSLVNHNPFEDGSQAVRCIALCRR